MAAKSFTCRLVTPTAKLIDEQVTYANIPLWDGLMGILPGYATIGIWAPILLVVLRIVQGIGVGGEWGAVYTIWRCRVVVRVSRLQPISLQLRCSAAVA